MRRCLPLLPFLLLVVSARVAPVRSQGLPAQIPTGQGLILGRVLDGTSNRGVAGAAVTLLPGGRNAASPVSVLAGPDGAFVFKDLPAGAFGVRVSLVGWISGRALAITLGDGEKYGDAVLTLSRAGAISGQVLDETGEGIEGISINLMSMGSAGGRRTFTSIRDSLVTDDRGMYRACGLIPGEYVVCTLFSRHTAPIVTGSGSGYRLGDFALISGSGSRNVDPAPDESGRQAIFADVCAGGTSSPMTAPPVVVESGQERTQINLPLRLVPAVSVVGTLVGPPDLLAGQTVHLLPANLDPDALLLVPDLAYSDVDRNGRFGFVGVPAGAYVLRTQISATSDISEVRNSQGLVVNRMETGRNPKPAMWAMAPVNVGETDVTDVALVLREAATVSGQIVFDGAAPRPTVAQLTTTALLFDQTSTRVQGLLTADGKVTVAGVLPGRYRLRMSGVMADWSLKSIIADGVDASDDGIEIAGSDVTGVTITMTDRPTHVSGTVHDATGAADRRAVVAVFTADRTRWARLVSGRRAVSQTVSARGDFDVSSLPAGDYLVVAVSDRVRVDWTDQTQLTAIAQAATHVTVRDGERTTVSLATSAVR